MWKKNTNGEGVDEGGLVKGDKKGKDESRRQEGTGLPLQPRVLISCQTLHTAFCFTSPSLLSSPFFDVYSHLLHTLCAPVSLIHICVSEISSSLHNLEVVVAGQFWVCVSFIEIFFSGGRGKSANIFISKYFTTSPTFKISLRSKYRSIMSNMY